MRNFFHILNLLLLQIFTDVFFEIPRISINYLNYINSYRPQITLCPIVLGAVCRERERETVLTLKSLLSKMTKDGRMEVSLSPFYRRGTEAHQDNIPNPTTRNMWPYTGLWGGNLQKKLELAVFTIWYFTLFLKKNNLHFYGSEINILKKTFLFSLLLTLTHQKTSW